MIPAPAVGLLWTIVDIALCRFSVLHPIYYLVESTLLMGLNIALGIITVMLYRYLTTAFTISKSHTNIVHQLGLFWLLGAWPLYLVQWCRVSALVAYSRELATDIQCSYIAIMIISARLVHKHRTRPQSRGAAA